MSPSTTTADTLDPTSPNSASPVTRPGASVTLMLSATMVAVLTSPSSMAQAFVGPTSTQFTVSDSGAVAVVPEITRW